MSDVSKTSDQSAHAQGSGRSNSNNNNRSASSHGTSATTTITNQRDRPRNTYLRRDKAAGKKSLLQQQLQQQGHLSGTGTSSASSASKAGEPGTDQQQQQHDPQQLQRQRVVAFGAATFKKALRGWSGVPGKRLCYRLQQRLPVVLVDEYRTSQVSNVTLEPQQDVFYRKKGETKLTSCWALKQYEVRNSSNGQVFKGLADRNRNAAANIRDLLSYWLVHHDRPVQFKNEKKNQQQQRRSTTKTTEPQQKKKRRTTSSSNDAGVAGTSTQPPATPTPPKRVISPRVPRN